MEDIKHDIEKDLEVIEEEAKKINCEPVFKVFNAVGKLICDILKCFKIKNFKNFFKSYIKIYYLK